MIQLRRDTAANWTAANPVLLAGEPAFERNTGKFKMGNGTSAWNALPYATLTPAEITALINSVLDGAPTALNTLNELADALGDDPNFAATVTALIAAKYTKPSGGIPATDLAAAVQASLAKADSAVQAAALATKYTKPGTGIPLTDLAQAVRDAIADGGGSGGVTTPSVYEFEMDFTTKSVGAMPSTADTGQPTWLVYNPTANALPVISNPGGGSRYTIASTDAAARAGYYNVELANTNVTYLSAKFEGGVGLMAWRDRFAPGQLATAIQGSICHFGATLTGWQYGIWNQSTGLAIIASRNYSTARSASAVQNVSIRIDKAAGKAWVTGDDGVEVVVTDSRISAYDCKFACCEIYYGNAATEPRQKIYNFKASSAAGGLPTPGSGSGSGSSTNNNDYGIINVRDKGAVGDGVTDDSAAFIAAFTEAEASKVTGFNAYGDPRGSKEIYVPPGTYLLKQANALFRDVGSLPMSGLKWRGAGLDATEIVFQPTAANQSLAYNPDRFYHLTFSDMTFYVDGTYASTAKLIDSLSNGHAQNYVFNRDGFSGTTYRALALRGSNNNSEMVFNDCSMHMSHPGGGAFLHSPPAGANPTDGSDQFLNYSFRDCQVEYATGNFIDMASGGNINVDGGSYIHAGDGTETTSTAQCFFKLRGAQHNAGSSRLSVKNIRVEHRHRNSTLESVEWADGNIEFDNIDTEIYAWILADPSLVVQSEYGGGGANSYPKVTYKNCKLMGKRRIHYNAGTYAVSRPGFIYDNCKYTHTVPSGGTRVLASPRAADYYDFVNDSGTTNPAGIPVVDIIGRSNAMANVDQKEVFDCTLNWQAATNMPVTPKYVSLRPAAGGLPVSGGAAYVNLPLNALITRVRCFKGAGGANGLTNVTYTLTDGSGTQIAQAVTGAAWSTSWAFDSGFLRVFCNTDAKRTLTLTASANIAETAADLFFLVEYLA